MTDNEENDIRAEVGRIFPLVNSYTGRKAARKLRPADPELAKRERQAKRDVQRALRRLADRMVALTEASEKRRRVAAAASEPPKADESEGSIEAAHGPNDSLENAAWDYADALSCFDSCRDGADDPETECADNLAWFRRAEERISWFAARVRV
jgi:hypothetical protein